LRARLARSSVILLMRVGTLLVVSLAAVVGAFFVYQALYFSRMVCRALVMRTFERPDFMGDMSIVRIAEAADPDWFWGNVEFYSVVSVILGAIAFAFLLPLAICVKNRFLRKKAHNVPD
jgi:hypothetical protein